MSKYQPQSSFALNWTQFAQFAIKKCVRVDLFIGALLIYLFMYLYRIYSLKMKRKNEEKWQKLIYKHIIKG